jgi:hypothetical protein
MKAYLLVTGTVFGLIALMHLLKSINDWPTVTTNPWGYIGMSALGSIAAGLSGWAWWLLRNLLRT